MNKLLLMLSLCTLQAASQTCIPNSHSLLFNGSSASADCITDNNLNIADSITVEAWIYAASWATTSAQGTIVCKHSWTQQEQGFVLRAGGNGELSWNFAGLDTNGAPVSWVEVVSNANALSLNTWHHVAGTFDGQTLNIYIDGQLAGNTLFSGTMIPGTAYPMKIGKLADTGQFQERLWNGRIDEVRIWHRALSQTEIDNARNNHIDSTSAGLVGYWRFNEGTGNTAFDMSSSGNHLSLSTQWITMVPFNDAPPVPQITLVGFALTTNAVAAGYQWLLNNNPVPGATQSGFTPTQSGLYSVTITSAAGCTATSVQVNYIVGISENDQSLQYELLQYNDIIRLKLNRQDVFNSCSIYDITGKLVYEQLLESSDHLIDVSTLNPGIYSLVLTGISTATEKILVRQRVR